MNKLFVYGTLKRSFHNHKLIEEIKGSSEFVKNGRTRWPSYFMRENGGFPAVFFKNNNGCFISGELYSISDSLLARCDGLEGHPVWYQRRNTTLVTGEECWMYVMRDKFVDHFKIDVRVEQNTQRF